jgi:hypothetical protein
VCMKDDWSTSSRSSRSHEDPFFGAPAATSTLAIYDVRFTDSSRPLCAKSHSPMTGERAKYDALLPFLGSVSVRAERANCGRSRSSRATRSALWT